MGRYQFINGHYTATYNGVDVGTTEKGFRIHRNQHVEKITVDESGNVPIDAINMGVEEAIEMDFVEYEKVKKALLMASDDGATPTMGKSLAKVGVLQSALGKALVLTPAGGASSTTPKYTAPCAIVEGDVDVPLGTGLKKGHCVFTCYPDPTQTTNAAAQAIQEATS